MQPPTFPAPFVIQKVQALGYGSGPWHRQDLVERWGTTSADKFVRDARSAGWLLSPRRGTYYVPPALELMTVSWLGADVRSEYLVSRTLARSGLRFWCVSSWCRTRGLDLGGPVFVTDLMPAQASAPEWSPDQGLPFLDNLVIVPSLPALDWTGEGEVYFAPEADEARTLWQAQHAAAGSQVMAALGAQILGLEVGGIAVDHIQEGYGADKRARGIPYTVGPAVIDDAWIVAFLAALGMSRVDEVALQHARQHPGLDRRAVGAAAASIGAPQPNAQWRSVLDEGPFPYLLVPLLLWDQMGADQAARRARVIERILGGT